MLHALLQLQRGSGHCFLTFPAQIPGVPWLCPVAGAALPCATEPGSSQDHFNIKSFNGELSLHWGRNMLMSFPKASQGYFIDRGL